MSVYRRLTGAVDKGPSGAHIAAFFDLDRTLLAGFSATAFTRELVRTGRLGWGEIGGVLAAATRFQLGLEDFSSFVAALSGSLVDMPEREMVELGERLFRDELAGSVYPESRALVRAHQRKGHTVAVVSSALPYQIAPLARDLEIDDVLCTRLEVRGGRFTGAVVHPTCYGMGKATAAQGLAARRGIDLAQSFFYTDSDEDLPLLDIVGRPRPLNPNRNLKAIAAKRGWTAKTFASRGTPAGEQLLRTGLAVGSLVPSLLVGLPAALLDRSWRPAVNLAISIWGDMGTALAGLDVQVTGEANLWTQRPAVFIFNHQSAIDPLLLCKVLRRDFVGIAKREIRDVPVLGQAFEFAGTVFIDRFNHDQAVKALEPAIEALRKGISLVIAPEGTRSPTPRLGRLKKGAFHMAMAARAPIVPIVFRNAHDVLPKSGYVMRPTTVEVVVLPPISTKRWRKADLQRNIEKIEAQYRSTLAD